MKKLLILVALLTCACAPALAEPTRTFSAGMAVKRSSALAADFSVRLSETPDDYWQVSLSLVGEAEGLRNNAALQGLYVMKRGRWHAGLGVALLQNTDSINGSRANFALQAGYSVSQSWQVQWRHWSNAGTKRPNLGRDMLWLGRTF